MKIIKAEEIENFFFEYQEIEDIGKVKDILNEVKLHGDKAVRKYTNIFDKVELAEFKISKEEIKKAYDVLSKEVIDAIYFAKENLEKFALKQRKQFVDFEMETFEGVYCGQKVVPLESVCVYAPGGNFPLPSSVLMGGIPAKVAGVEKIILCSPPTYEKSLHPAILLAADVAQIDEIYKIGGVQAIGAAAYGTESIPKVDLIVGPGNKYVTYAKKMVYGTVGIDFIAGPSEVLIIADDKANPVFIASDLLAQAEHDVNAESILICLSEIFAKKVKEEVENQLKILPTKGIAKESLLKNGKIIIAQNLEDACKIANKKAPEHLEIQIENPDLIINKLKNYGSLFIGELSVEAFGDYAAGINHILPTSMAAKYTSGLSVRNFLKTQTTLRVEKLDAVKKFSEIFAKSEGLLAHYNSINIRK